MAPTQRAAREGAARMPGACEPEGFSIVEPRPALVNHMDLLNLGISPCGRDYRGIDLQLYACGRPEGHYGAHYLTALPGDPGDR